MSAPCLIIDGYNLLHAAGLARADYGPGDLQRCRTQLIRYLLQRLTPAEIGRATIVFDARDPPEDRAHRFVVSGLTVLFANPAGDADTAIEQLIAAHRAPQQLRLISSDRRLQMSARAFRAQQEASDVFLQRLEQRGMRLHRSLAGQGRSAGAAATGRGQDRLPTDAAEWLAYFGISDLAELSTDGNRDRVRLSRAPSPERDLSGADASEGTQPTALPPTAAPPPAPAAAKREIPGPPTIPPRPPVPRSSPELESEPARRRPGKVAAQRRGTPPARGAFDNGDGASGRGSRGRGKIVPLTSRETGVSWEHLVADAERLVEEGQLPPADGTDRRS